MYSKNILNGALILTDFPNVRGERKSFMFFLQCGLFWEKEEEAKASFSFLRPFLERSTKVCDSSLVQTKHANSQKIMTTSVLREKRMIIKGCLLFSSILQVKFVIHLIE